MKRIPKDIRKYCRDQRFVYTYRNSYEEITINFRMTNIVNEYNDKNPIKARSWEDININIVVDGTVASTDNDGTIRTRTLTEYFDWELRWNPRSPRTKIRRMIGGGRYNSYSYGYGHGTNREDKGQFDLFLKCMNLYDHRIKLKTIKFGKV